MIRKVKSKLLTSIKNKKINVFMLFLFLAFVILIFTKLSKIYTGTIPFKVVYINVPEEKVILNNSDSLLEVTLKTHGFRWLDYYFDKPKIKIDFSKDVSVNRSNFIWTKSKAGLLAANVFAKQVEVLNVSPDTLFFKYDVNMVKKVPVTLNADITYSQGFNSFKDFEVTPDSVKIIGPKANVKAIEAIETETITLKDVKSNIDKAVKLKLPADDSAIKFSSTWVNLRANVERFTEGSLKIPIVIINAPQDLKIKYFPKEVTLTYYTSLTNFKLVKPSDFKLVCDYSKVDEEHSFFVPELIKTSPQVKSVKINNPQIEFIILK